MKKLFLIIASLLLIVMPLTADDEAWWIDQPIEKLVFTGLKNITEDSLSAVKSAYQGEVFTDGLFEALQTDVYSIDGVDLAIFDVDKDENGKLLVLIEITELPMIGKLTFNGNEKVKTTALKEALVSTAVGQFLDVYRPQKFSIASDELTSVYKAKGYLDATAKASYTLNEETNQIDLVFDIEEGIQQVVTEIGFEGNDSISDKILSKELSIKVKSMFNAGGLDLAKVQEDAASLEAYYHKNGFVDVILGGYRVDNIDDEKDELDYQKVKVTFLINEGLQWRFGGYELSGNTLYSNEELLSKVTSLPGQVINSEQIQSDVSLIVDKYYNEGYIYNSVDLKERRDDASSTITYLVSIGESMQARIGEITFSGITRTNESVFRRELAMKTGEVFSRAALITSYQNLYNTGLLSNLTWNLVPTKTGEDVDIEFVLEEGNQKDIQFGATFGGSVTGFPISGFLQWNDKNLFGLGNTLAINTTLSPDSQSASVSFTQNWTGLKRWSQTYSVSFSRDTISDVLQRGAGSDYDSGRSQDVYPLGYSSAEAWEAAGNTYPDNQYLMNYDMIKFSLGYSTGYTFILKPARLTISAGLSFGLNHSIFDSSLYDPLSLLTLKYSQGWQMSNKLSLAFQWDGRDLIDNTTKGYMLTQSFSFAGGLLGGLSNYIKSTSLAAGYFKLFSTREGTDKRNCIFSATSTVNLMLPQLYNNKDDTLNPGWGWHDARLGSTVYEMLYIDGMTIARGFSTVTDQAFLWDSMLEIGYPLAKDVLQAEAFASATALSETLDVKFSTLDWYMAAGIGAKLKIPGFPIGIYLVKNATVIDNAFAWDTGAVFNSDMTPGRGMKVVLAISTSLI